MTTREVIKASILTVIITLVFILLLKDITVFTLDAIVDLGIGFYLNVIDSINNIKTDMTSYLCPMLI